MPVLLSNIPFKLKRIFLPPMTLQPFITLTPIIEIINKMFKNKKGEKNV